MDTSPRSQNARVLIRTTSRYTAPAVRRAQLLEAIASNRMAWGATRQALRQRTREPRLWLDLGRKGLRIVRLARTCKRTVGIVSGALRSRRLVFITFAGLFAWRTAHELFSATSSSASSQ